MENFLQLEYIMVLLIGSIILSLLIAVLGIKIAPQIGLMDIPGSAEHKNHLRSIPLVGGIVLMDTLIIIILITQMWRNDNILAIAISGIIIGLFGLLDDFISLNVTKKLFGQLLASIILVSLGVQVNFFDSPEFFFQIGYPWEGYLNIIFTLLWLIVITNAFNFIDSMDGLAVGLSGLSSSFFLLISMYTGQLELIFLAVIILGVCIALYYFNSQPARLFLGDSGAQLLGFLLACIAIIYQPKVGFQTSTWFVPILLFSVPLFDMFLVIISRLKRGKKIHKASQDHTFHRLSQLGIPMHQAVLMMHGISLILSMIGFLCLNLSEIYANFIFLLVLSLGIITFIKLDKNYS